jgi:hypothetical protein
MRISSYITLVGMSLAVAVGWGCGGGGGCGLGPLPKDPAPVGIPYSQVIEGGAQARVTKPGFDKLSSLVPTLAQKALAQGFCVPKQTQNLLIGDVSECGQMCGQGAGCPVQITLRGDISPPGGIGISVPDGTNPTIHIDAAFDVNVPMQIDAHLFGIGFDVCTMNVSSPGTHVIADVNLGIDPTTGELTINLGNIDKFNLNLGFSNCGFFSDFLDAVAGAVNGIINSFIGQFIIGLLKGPLNSIIQGFLPNPPGLAGTMNMGKTLASLNAPADANLEVFLVAGGYVSAFGGGLNLGLLSGINSDRDQSTRGAGLTSEPSLCVPSRPVPDLGGPPWNLPFLTARRDFQLDAAPEFAGNPDPMDMNGVTQDLAIGISRTFLDLAGFHLYNSGSLCLAIDGAAIAQLNAGTVSVLVPSLQNILEDRKSPLALVLRPQTPLNFMLGAGTPQDSLIHVAVSDMRIDFYAFIEQRYVRLFTLALDMNVGINLAITMDMAGNPAVQAMVTGIDKSSVMARVSNSDLLQEDPAKLAKQLLSLIDIAVGQLMGALKPFPLPSLMGFSLDGLQITRVQTKQDDFLAIYGDLVQNPMMMMAQIPQNIVPVARTPHGVETMAQILDVSVPPGDVIAQAMLADKLDPSNLPSVTLALGGNHDNLEWQVKVDAQGWHPWSANARPTISDPSFILQGHHKLQVRARIQGDWLSEDQTPQLFDVLIDSVPPELHPVAEGGQLKFGGWDNVTDDKNLRYSWSTPAGFTKLDTINSLSYDDAWAASKSGTEPFSMKVVDEAGNENIFTLDLPGMTAFHGRTTTPSSGGCGCSVGGARRDGEGALALLSLFSLGGLLAWRRLRRAPARTENLPKPVKRNNAPAALAAIVVAASLNAGCNCGDMASNSCHVDDDCRGTMCDNGTIPQCQSGTCGCIPDVAIGEIGRYASLAMRGPTAYIAAYNNTYGDLMIGHISPPGVVDNWEFVDGIPETESPDNPASNVRGGITDPGDDVGRFASIQVNPSGDPVIAYYDQTNASLKFASFGAVRWHTHTVDKATGVPGMGGDDFGRYASLTLGKDGSPGIAYYAEVKKGASGMREGQLRFAQAKTPFPSAATDWVITTVETRVMPTVDPKAPPSLLPEGIALFCASARKSDGSPVVAYYDYPRGNLRYVEYSASTSKWGTAEILDGEDAMGGDTGDVGQYPSVVVDGMVSHITYVDASHDNLLYVDTMNKTPEVIDDGYRPKDEQTQDGLDSPVYHLVGDSSSVQILQGKLMVAYQDSTVEQLRFATKDPMTMKWELSTVAGHGTPFSGSYGFYAQVRIAGSAAVLSSYAINQHLETPSFYVETFGVDLNTVM